MSNFSLKDEVSMWRGNGRGFWMCSTMKPVGFHLLILELIYFCFSSPFLIFFFKFKQHYKDYAVLSQHSVTELICSYTSFPETKVRCDSAGCRCNMKLLSHLRFSSSTGFITCKTLWISKLNRCGRTWALQNWIVHSSQSCKLEFATCSHFCVWL